MLIRDAGVYKDDLQYGADVGDVNESLFTVDKAKRTQRRSVYRSRDPRNGGGGGKQHSY